MYRGDGAHSACTTKLLVTPTAGTEELSQFNYRHGGVRVLREWSCSVCVRIFNGCTERSCTLFTGSGVCRPCLKLLPAEVIDT